MGDSNGAGFGVPGADACVARLGEAASKGTPALALRAAAASMMRRAAARFRASGVADAELDGDAPVSASADLCAPASGERVCEGLGVEVADSDTREGPGGGENTKFVTGSLAARGESHFCFAGLAAAMMRRAAATLSIAGEARRSSSRFPCGVDGNEKVGGLRGVRVPGLEAKPLASAECMVSSSAKRAISATLSARGGDAGGGIGPPPARSAARSAAAAASESHPSRHTRGGFVFDASEVFVASVSLSISRRGKEAALVGGSGVGSKARHGALESPGVFAFSNAPDGGEKRGVASASRSSQSSSTSLSVFFERAGDARTRGGEARRAPS